MVALPKINFLGASKVCERQYMEKERKKKEEKEEVSVNKGLGTQTAWSNIKVNIMLFILKNNMPMQCISP